MDLLSERMEVGALPEHVQRWLWWQWRYMWWCSLHQGAGLGHQAAGEFAGEG